MARSQLLENIKDCTRRFPIHEYKEHVISAFQPYISWKDVKEKLAKDKSKITRKMMSEPLLRVAQTLGGSKQYDILLTLHLNDIVYHRGRRVWNTFKLLRKEEKELNLVTLYKTLRESCKKYISECAVKCYAQDEMLWIIMVDKGAQTEAKRNVRKKKTTIDKGAQKETQSNVQKKNTTRVRKIRPAFFIYFLDEPYLFISGVPQGKPGQNVVKSVLLTLQYDSAKTCHLVGRDVLSLRALLQNKKEKKEPAEYMFAKTRKGPSGGTDFTQHISREQFVERQSGTNPPVIDTYSVNVRNVPWEVSQGIPEMKDVCSDVTFTFKSKNVLETMAQWQKIGAISTKSPVYVNAARFFGKNTVEVTDKDET